MFVGRIANPSDSQIGRLFLDGAASRLTCTVAMADSPERSSLSLSFGASTEYNTVVWSSCQCEGTGPLRDERNHIVVA
jgi:hypothetical protein